MEKLGLYVHIPFCIKKCLYCDFLSFAGEECKYEAYADALINELKRKSCELKDFEIDTIFFGGGTPTVLSAFLLEKISDAVFSYYNTADNYEFTVEANPGTLDGKKLKALKACGVNRLSIGLQAWQNRLLSALGRIHTREIFLESFWTAYDFGFKNINIDLMFSLPEQTFADWEETLAAAAGLPAAHLSCYSLIIEEGTPFSRLRAEGRLHLPSEDADRRMYALTRDILKDAGYRQYEISNYAKPGFECRHNIKYWKTLEYAGFGAGAHSYLFGKRFFNTEALTGYIECRGENTEREEAVLSVRDKISEFMFMGLRMTDGVSKADFKERFSCDIKSIFGSEIEMLEENGFMDENDANIFLTQKGVDVSNEIFVKFI